MNLSKHDLCSQVQSEATGGQSLLYRCRGNATGQVSVPPGCKAGAFGVLPVVGQMVTPMPLPRAALLIISIETGRVKGEK